MQAHTPRKRFGQNFLVDATAIAKIIDAIAPAPADRIVEIGPGLAALTAGLLVRVSHIDAIEIDRDLCARLREQFAPEHLTLHVGDALEFDYRALGADLRIIGNLPYNISSPLLFRLAACADVIRDVHVMLQREVVDRMVARPGTTQYGRLTVTLGYRFEIERVLRVPAGAFRPIPKVDSAFVRMRPLTQPATRARDETVFARVVKAAFGQRRKTLRNALAGIAQEVHLIEAGVDASLRAEVLDIEKFVAIANAVALDPRQSPGSR